MILPWDDYFMYVAKLSSRRSKDPKVQVGACVVDPDNKISGIGYNGFPRGCSDQEFPWTARSESESLYDSKHAYVCHAEVNAIMNCSATNLKGNVLYVTHFPCHECAKIIIQSDITKVVYLQEHKPGDDSYRATRRMFKAAGVGIFKLMPSFEQIVLKLN